MSGSRATKIHKFRKYRSHKRVGKRPRATLKIDRGQIEETVSLIFPQKSEVRYSKKPTEANPDLLSFNFGNIRVCYYYKDRRGFFYDCDGIYLGSFMKHDLKNAFWEIGTVLKTVQTQKG